MTRKAAKTMLDLPEPLHVEHRVDRMEEYYTADQMREYGEACAAQLRAELDRIEELGTPWVPELLEWLGKHDCCPALPFTDYELIEALEARFGEAALSQTAGVTIECACPAGSGCSHPCRRGWRRILSEARALPPSTRDNVLDFIEREMLAAAPAASGGEDQ